MPLDGPVRPIRYFASPAPGPQPASGFGVGELVTCPGTGRMWIAKSGTPGDVSQVLPYVRTDDGLTAVQAVNSTGNLLIQRPAGATGGEVNFFNNLVVDPSGIRFGNLTQPTTSPGPLLCKTRNFAPYDGEVFVPASPSKYVLSADVTLGTTPTVIADLTYTAPSTESYSIPYRFNLGATFYHNNQYTVHVGLVRYTTATVYGTQVSTSIHSHLGGYVQANLEWYGELNYGFSYAQKLEIVAFADVSGVLMKRLPGTVSFPEYLPVLSDNAATYLNIERRG